MEEKKKQVNEAELIPALIRYQKALQDGGIVWTEEQLDFLRDLSEELAINILAGISTIIGQPIDLESYLEIGNFRTSVDAVVNAWSEKGYGKNPQTPILSMEPRTFEDHLKDEEVFTEKLEEERKE